MSANVQWTQLSGLSSIGYRCKTKAVFFQAILDTYREPWLLPWQQKLIIAFRMVQDGSSLPWWWALVVLSSSQTTLPVHQNMTSEKKIWLTMLAVAHSDRFSLWMERICVCVQDETWGDEIRDGTTWLQPDAYTVAGVINSGLYVWCNFSFQSFHSPCCIHSWKEFFFFFF